MGTALANQETLRLNLRVMVRQTPGIVTASGTDIVSNATEVDTSKVATELAAFTTVNTRHDKAQADVEAADAAVKAQTLVVGSADGDQDEDVDELAAALAGAGEPRSRPFKRFGGKAVSRLKDEAADQEADDCLKLIGEVKKSLKAEAVTKACNALEGTAKIVKAECKKLVPLEAARSKAITRRDAIARAWARSRVRLRTACKLSDQTHGTTLEDDLFGGGSIERKGKPKKRKK